MTLILQFNVKGQEATWKLMMKSEVLSCVALISGAKGQRTARGLQVSTGDLASIDPGDGDQPVSREEGTTTPVVAARRERERAAGHGRNAEVLEFLGVLDFFLFFF